MRLLLAIFLFLLICHWLSAQQYVFPMLHVSGTLNPASRLEQDTASVMFHMNSFQDYREGRLTNYIRGARIQEEYRHTFLHFNYINKKRLFHHGFEVGEVFRGIRFSTSERNQEMNQIYNSGYLKYYINTSPVLNLTIGMSTTCVAGYYRGYFFYYDWIYDRKIKNDFVYGNVSTGFTWSFSKFSLGTSIHLSGGMTSYSPFSFLASFKHQWNDNTFYVIDEFHVGFSNNFNISLSLKERLFIAYQHQRGMVNGEYFTDLNSVFVAASLSKSGLDVGFGAHLKFDGGYNFWVSPTLKYNLGFRCVECQEQRQLKRALRKEKRNERVRYNTFYY